MITLSALAEAGTAVVVATHDMDVAYAWADRIAIFADRRVAMAGRPQEVFSNPKGLNELGLRPPIVAEIAHQFEQVGLIPPGTSWPRDRQHLAAMIADFPRLARP
jgi:cobalt/nickel transport system ATP-binding protein